MRTAYKYFLKFICLFSIVVVVLMLLSPIISLFLPYNLRYHAYQRLIFNAIVDKETKGCKTDEEKVLALFNYVVKHERAQGIPYKCKPLDSLIYGEAYCDFQARTLNLLLGIAGIPSRYAMLLDKDGISPHTLNEVFLNNKWCVYDTTMNIVFMGQNGNKLSLTDLTLKPELIYDIGKISALKKYDEAGYENLIALYQRVLPIVKEPRRSTPVLYQMHIFDYTVDVYFKIFKGSFLNFYQDIYLASVRGRYKEEDSFLFYKARNYHLAYRTDLAASGYKIILNKYFNGSYYKEASFFNKL